MFRILYYWFHRLTSHPQERGEYSSGYWQCRIRQEALILCKGVRGRILEIGCGEGLFLSQLARQNPESEIWGIDNVSERLKMVEERTECENLKNMNLSLQNAENLSFKDASFDTVICINFLLNLKSIESVRRILNQMKRVCKKSGRLIFEFRNSLNILVAFKYRFAKYYDSSDIYLNAYNPKEIASILKDLGIVIVTKRFIGFPLNRFAPIIFIEAEKDVC